MFLGKADIFLFTDLIFFRRMNIGILKENWKSIPDSINVSMTSPEHGAQQEWSKSLSWPAGRVSVWRSNLLDMILRRYKYKPNIWAIP